MFVIVNHPKWSLWLAKLAWLEPVNSEESDIIGCFNLMQRIKLALSAVATKYWVQLQNQKLEAGNETWLYGQGRHLRRLGEKTVALKSSQPANKGTRKLQRYVKGNKCRKLELCICLGFQLSKLHFYFFRSPEKERTDSKSFTRQLFRLFISRSFPPSRVFRPGSPWPIISRAKK